MLGGLGWFIVGSKLAWVEVARQWRNHLTMKQDAIFFFYIYRDDGRSRKKTVLKTVLEAAKEYKSKVSATKEGQRQKKRNCS